jgi:glutamate synthase (NADPH) large chain
MRKCHLNTCPVGIATQDPVLRAKFTGQPEHVVRFMFYVAEETREIMASLGFRTIKEMVGQVDRIRQKTNVKHWKASKLDFSDVLMPAAARPGVGVSKSIEQDHGLSSALDVMLIERCKAALDKREHVRLDLPVRNVHRTIGGMLGGEVARRFGQEGLPEGTIDLHFTGSAGQSFGAFVTRGMTLSLEGDANDYVGKGMSGGILAIRPLRGVDFRAEKNIIVGNTALYGATSGKAFLNGMGGERFAVRNSGATAVIEGVGDHGCEYMTGGHVLVLGPTGRNFGAGMSGGLAYVLDEAGDFKLRCNTGMVELEGLSPEDASFVAGLLEEHRVRTGSPKAAELLASWETSQTRFVKVVPTEYRRVLAELAKREKVAPNAGLPVLQPDAKAGARSADAE